MDGHRGRITSTMKRALTIVAVALALPLLAEEPAKKTEEKAAAAAKAQPVAKPQPVTLTPAPAGQQDSPLVAAARRSNRLGRKPANVITNKTLRKASDAHITTTENQTALQVPPPPGPTPEMIHAQKREDERRQREAAEKRKREIEEKRQERIANAAERAEEGLYGDGEGDDEATGERDLQKANAKKPPQF